MKISIEAPALGKAEGTTAWIMQHLNNVELSIQSVKGGGIGLFGRQKGKGDEPKIKWNIIAWYYPGGGEQTQGFDKHWGDDYWTVPATEKESYFEELAYFGRLTPAAKKIAQDFIDKCGDVLRERIETDGAEQGAISIDLVHEQPVSQSA